jgi:hypothetical protein
MGSHTNYHIVIHQLILHKEEFSRLKKPKYQDILQELSRFTIEPDSDNDKVPDHKLLAEKFRYKQSRMNSLLKEIYDDLIEDINIQPIVVKNYVYTIHIALDPDEFNGTVMENIEKACEQATTICMTLPIPIQIGDEIEIPIVSETGNFSRGYVQRIQHRISGYTQDILLWVHPFRDYYYKWMDMKEDYERRQSWLRNLRNRDF